MVLPKSIPTAFLFTLINTYVNSLLNSITYLEINHWCEHIHIPWVTHHSKFDCNQYCLRGFIVWAYTYTHTQGWYNTWKIRLLAFLLVVIYNYQHFFIRSSICVICKLLLIDYAASYTNYKMLLLNADTKCQVAFYLSNSATSINPEYTPKMKL